MSTSILIVDDEVDFLDSVARMLRIEGYENVTAVSNPREVDALLNVTPFDMAFLDITMPEMDGIELLEVIKKKSPQTECVMITANEGIGNVIRAIKLGAYDYLLKPVMPEQLTHALEKALERKHLLESLLLKSRDRVEKSLKTPEAFQDIITGDSRMLKLMHECELHAESSIPILVTGETGVGKELLARAVHQASRRAAGPFVAVNMLALSPSLFESEFFGHAKGAFTGADRDKEGYLGKARGGTLFLDEIGDLSMEIQGKLLRILQEGEYTPVGKTRAERADIRFVAATNQDLEARVEEGVFRKDLFFRLQFAHLRIPALRERRKDIPALAASFIHSSIRPNARLSSEAEEMLARHEWPGNVRELRGMMEAAANLAEKGTILPEHLRLPASVTNETPVEIKPTEVGGMESLADVEKRHIVSVYEALKNNKSQTARVLEIGLQTLHRKLKSYGLK